MSKDRLSVRTLATKFFDIARTVLVRDGYHSYLCVLITDKGAVPFSIGSTSDEKQEMMMKVAEKAKSIQAYAAVFVTEAWAAAFDEAHPDRPASDAPTKSELLFLSAIDDGGHEFYISAPFERTNGTIKVGATIERDSSSIQGNIFEPLRKMWTMKKHRN